MIGLSAFSRFFLISVITLTLGVVSSQTVVGKNYYFSSTTGDDTRTSTQAQNQATPWKTISKLNTFFPSLAAGDSVLFKRGETFYGAIKATKSGTSTAPIVIGAYGSGAKPILSGFSTLSSWTSIGSGIYQCPATACKPTVNLVVVNGVRKAIGRYPNTGYLTFETHSGTVSITDNQLTATPNWTGAEVVIRKNRWVTDRNPITNHSGNTISYTTGSTYPGIDGFGYFIQKDPKTLDQVGEWYFEPKSKNMQMYFGSNNPASYIVNASSVDTLILINGYNYLTFTNLALQGANNVAFQVTTSDQIKIVNCNINFSGKDAIRVAGGSDYFLADNNTIRNTNNNAIQIAVWEGVAGNSTVTNNIVSNTGLVEGMNENGDGANIGINVKSDNSIIQYNRVDSSGYIGIEFDGNNTKVKNNLVNYFCMLKEDGGGIYAYQGSYVTRVGQAVTNNIVLNGVGAQIGTNNLNYLLAHGIDLDGRVQGVTVADNTVANCPGAGIMLNWYCKNIPINNNTCYNNLYQMQSKRTYPADPAAFSILNNIFFARTTTQQVWLIEGASPETLGTMNNNYYCRPLNDSKSFYQSGAVGQNYFYLSLSEWQTKYKQDLNSRLSPKSVTDVNDILFEYNATKVNKIVPLNGTYVNPQGNSFSGSITLLPYTSVVLIKTASGTSSNLSPSIQNQVFQLNESAPNGTIVGTVVASDPNAGQLLTYSIVSGNTNNAFSINPTTGVLTVATSTALNYETASSFSLIVKVQDNGTGNMSSQANITINIVNLNEPPSISNQTFTTKTGSPNGTVVGSVIASDADAGQTLVYSIISGNTNNAFAINASSGILTIATSSAINYQTTPTYALIVKIQDNGTGLLSNQATITVNITNVSGCTATGNISYQVWNNINGIAVSNLTSNTNYPSNPSSTSLINLMESNSNIGSNFGARIAGFICAPTTGNYTFWISGNENCELWLSTNDQAGTKQKIAYHTSYTTSREWNKFSTQKSAAIYLTQGQTYYIEALMKESGGDDCLAVGWLKPGQTGTAPSEIIPGSVLSPLGSNTNQAPVINNQTFSVNENSPNSTTVGTVVASDPNPGQSLTYSIVSGNTNAAFAINAISGVLNVATSSALNYQTTPSFALIVKVQDNGSGLLSAQSTITVNLIDVIGCTATGNISYQVWNNINGLAVSDLTSNTNYPNNPSSTISIALMEGTPNLGNNFGARIAGYICAPATGNYSFWISGNENCELWLSTNDQASSKRKVAYHTSYTSSREWNKFATQKSATINLTQGQTYYIEALMKESGGDDCLAVGWLRPGQTGTVPSEIIPGSVLAPLGSKSSEIAKEKTMSSDLDVNLIVYPNPLGNDELNIKIENISSEVTLKIYSISGVEYYEEQINTSGIIHVDRSLFKSGVYIIKVLNSQFVKTSKLIVK